MGQGRRQVPVAATAATGYATKGGDAGRPLLRQGNEAANAAFSEATPALTT